MTDRKTDVIGIVVTRATKLVRRVIVPDSPYPYSISEINKHHIDPLEQILIVNNPHVPFTPAVVEQLVFNCVKIQPPSSRCAVVVMANAINGNVVGAIHADPSMDSVSGANLIPHPTADVGWTYVTGTGLKPPATAV